MAGQRAPRPATPPEVVGPPEGAAVDLAPAEAVASAEQVAPEDEAARLDRLLRVEAAAADLCRQTVTFTDSGAQAAWAALRDALG